MKVLVAQSFPTLCYPMDCSLPASSVHGIFQARTLEWVAFSSSRGFPDLRSEPGSLALQAESLPSETQGSEATYIKYPQGPAAGYVFPPLAPEVWKVSPRFLQGAS